MKEKDSFLYEQWDEKLILEAFNVIETLTSMERETHIMGFARSENVLTQHSIFGPKREMIRVSFSKIFLQIVYFLKIVNNNPQFLEMVKCYKIEKYFIR